MEKGLEVDLLHIGRLLQETVAGAGVEHTE
jgi:hypothetical protein